mgnify:CR=1 FL=1
MLYSREMKISAGRSALSLLLSVLLALGNPALAQDKDLNLPNLGESSTSMFSAEFEHELGRAWLRVFRSQVRTIDDPLLHDYLEHLVYKLVSESKLEDRRVEVVIIDSPEINAFAVPGGIIGINNGLLLYAQTEDELATVLSHEIAHLSQRHFSRGVEFQQKNQPLTLAAMIASFVLLATAGADAGMAAMSATQAAAQSSALRYSRTNEQEADRVGMQTLAEAGFDPHAAPAMFERMMQASRYSSSERVPEYLRSHPLTENRVADTRNRARQYPPQEPTVSLDYQLMRARVTNQLAASPVEAANKFRSELAGTPRSAEAANYGLVLALTAAGKPNEARLTLDGIWSRDPERMEYIIADARIDMARRKPEQAVAKLEARLKLTPGNFPLTMAYADALMADGKAHVAEPVLVAQSQLNPNDPGLWYLLAEVQGLSGNIVGLHQSRAEYFILNGNLDQAEKQLNYALKLTRGDFLNSAKITQRLADIAEMRAQMDA